MAKRQTLYLQKYKAYAKNKMLEDSRQFELRSQCMKFWQIPDDRRPDPPHPAPKNCFDRLCEVIV